MLSAVRSILKRRDLLLFIIGMASLGALAIVTKNQVFLYPMTFFVFFTLPIAGIAGSVGLAMFVISYILRYGNRFGSSLALNPEYASPLPSVKKMTMWTTINTVGLIASLVSGGGWIPTDILNFESNVGLVVSLYMPAIMIASAFNAAMWLMQWKGIMIKRKGYGEFNLGRYAFSVLSISIGVVGIARLIITSAMNGDPHGFVPLMLIFALFASISAAISFFIAKRTVFPRLMRRFQIKLDRLVA